MLLRRARRRHTLRVAVIVLAAALSVFAAATAGLYWTLVAFRGERVGRRPLDLPGQRVNVLFLGLDAPVDPVTGRAIKVDLRRAPTRSDTVIVASFDPETGEVGLVSLPRDTRVEIPGHGADKLAHAHAYGGVKLAVRTVEQFLGIPIHYYVRTNFEGFRRAVDIVGGIDLCVDRDMKYEDPYQALRIDLKAGCRRLDGDEALQYVRFREVRGDIGRIERQQKAIEALKDRVLSIGGLVRAPQLLAEMSRYIDTDMDPSTMLRYARVAARAPAAGLQMAFLPGEVKNLPDAAGNLLSFWVVDEAAVREMADRLLRGVDYERNAGIRVEVLNATGSEHGADAIVRRLQADRFRLVRVAATRDRDGTTVTGRGVSEDLVARVARSLGDLAPGMALFNEAGRPGQEGTVTVIAGRDLLLSQGASTGQ